MALIKFMGGIGAMSGKLGGNVFARNSSGSYVRQWAKPVNTNTARQSAVRNAVIQFSQRWKNSLSDLQRSQWAVYAQAVSWVNRLGETIKLSGFNMYMRSNCAINAADGLAVDDGPAILTLAEGDTAFAVAISEATQIITITFNDNLAWGGEDEAHMLVAMGTPVNTTRNFFNGPWKIAGALDGNTAVPLVSPLTLPAPYAAQEGQQVVCRARIMRADGRVSQFFRGSAVVGA
ncbi:MAG: hypothetical protein KAJ07_09080 [Planctomycetes bacterium]|nr:hypothetical protein [Planctomycetota bacterium]